MSKDNITAILGKVTLEFKKYDDGETIFRKGEKCDHFTILIQGKLSAVTPSPNGSYCITEEADAPFSIEAYSIFGYDTKYKRDYISKGNSTILSIDKQHIFGELSRHHIFTINLLNIISRRAQQMDEHLWLYDSTTIPGRIAQFIAARCETQKGEKHIAIKMEQLATLLCETRLNISKALNEMQEAGFLALHRGGITVHAIEKVLEHYK